MFRPAPPSSLVTVILALATALPLASSAVAQEAARSSRGTALNRNYAISDIENINLQNGNVHLSIPLAALPPIAGGKLSLTISANYNGKIWDMLRSQEEAADPPWSPYVVDLPGIGGGWSIGAGHKIQFRNANEDFNRVEYSESSHLSPTELGLLNNHQWWKIVLTGPDGSEHELRPLDQPSYNGSQDFLRGYFNVIPTGNPMRYYSTDGSYLFAVISSTQNWTVFMPDGSRIIQTPDGVQRIQDTNGNKIKIFSDANGTHYQDEQTYREIRVTYDPAGYGGQGQYRVWYPTVTGIQHHIDINMGTTTVQGKTYIVNDWDNTNEMVCQRTVGLSAQLPVVREIVFPQTEPGQQRNFVFSYNSDSTENATTSVNWGCSGGYVNYTRAASIGWGELSRVISPPGGTENSVYADYSYKLDSQHSLEFSSDDMAANSIVEKKLHHDGTSDIWSYGVSEVETGVTSPDGNWFVEHRYCATWGVPNCSTDKAGLAYRTTRPFVRTERHWTNFVFSGAEVIKPGGVVTFNPVVDFEYTTLLDASNNPLKMSAKAFQYDYNGNVTQTTEYDWFDPALVTRDAQGVPTGVPTGLTPLRVTSNSYYNQASSASSANVYAKRSVSTGAPLILNAIQQTTVGPATVQLSYDGQAYGVAPTAGNLTTKRVWDDLDSKWITTSNTYDLYGNVATATDARGKVTQFFYDDTTHALCTRVVVDPQNGTGTQTTSTAYDFWTGLVTSQTDVNGQVTTIDYTNQLLMAVDPFGRPGIIKSPTININGGNHRRGVTTTYLDTTRKVVVEADLNAESDKLLKTRTTRDMLGRPILSESTEDGTNYTISVRNAYLDMGRVTLTSSPMRGSAATTDSWTRITKDTAGRVTEVATFGGAAQPAWTGTAGAFTGAVTTAYNANFTTVTDQAGKVRRSLVDALGRLVRVDEPDKATGDLGPTNAPVQQTDYTYDVFGNLKKVDQGAQHRTFTYDSLSRLRTAINPESGTVTYQYDDNGNLLVKTDARAVSAHYDYDSINRVTRRWYNGSNSTSQTAHNVPALPSGVGATDEARFYYDSQTLPTDSPTFTRGSAVGRLVAQTYGAGTNGDYYAYDVLGRQTLKIQQTGAVNYQLSAGYTLSGAVSSLTYPSGHTISNTFDQAGRLTVFSGNLGDGTTRTYSTGSVYSALGSLLKEQFGTNNAVYHKLHYNSRAQLCDVRASNVNDEWGGELGALVNYYSTPFAHCGSGQDNNGNLLMSQTIINSVHFEDRYSYDSLNRLTAVNEYLNGSTYTGTQQYDYDPWGNRTLKPASTLGTYKEFAVDEANNRLGVPAGQPPSIAMDYDNAGNLINDTYTGAGNRTYDAENKITSAWGGNNQAQLYGYDAAGQRIKRTVDGVATWQVYGFGGELLAEYPANGPAASPQKEYGYRNGELLVTAEPATTQNVIWQNVVGASVSGSTVTKTAATGWGNAGATSAQSITAGAGYVELTVPDTTTHRFLGLSNGNSNSDYTDVDFAIHPVIGGTIFIYEGGISRGTFGSYTTGDVLRVAVEGGVVKYRRNGALLYTSTVTPTYPLLVDSALHGTGDTLSNVVISGAALTTTQTVIWQNVVGASVSGNSLTKTAATGWGNAGATSAQSITAGDGYVELTVPDTTTHRFLGLSNGNSNSDYTDVDFAIHPVIGGTIFIYEGGISRGTFGSYTTGDVLRVAVEGGVVKYRKNGALLYTSTVTPTYPLLVDSALHGTGDTLSNVVISGPALTNVESVVWQNMVGASVSGNTLTKTAATGWGNAGATSAQSITAGDGYVELTVPDTTTHRFCGLSNGNSNSDYTDVDFAIHPVIGGTIFIYEGGISRGSFGSYTTGDVLRVAVEGGVVKYRRNGALLYTSAITPTYPLLVDTALHGAGDTLSNVVISGISGSSAAVSSSIHWLVADHLGTPRMVIDQTGSLANVKRHDYLPFGEELPALIGGRTAPLGYSSGDGVRQQFTQKERDNETGLDYFGARYYSNMQGRFTSPDEFWKDSQVGDPQSWNKYAYARNNPLKYIDPNGEKATVTIETDEEKKKGTIKIAASIAIYTNDKNISQEALAKASTDIKSSIENAWKGQYEQNGIKFDVSAEITVTVQGSESEATKSGAQNVVEIFNDKPGEQSNAGRRGLFSGQDGGRWGINGISSGLAAHEFTHLLGVDNKNGPHLSNTNYISGTTATAYDYGWAFGGAINTHRAESRRPEFKGRQWETLNAGGPNWGPPRSHTSTRELRAAIIWWR